MKQDLKEIIEIFFPIFPEKVELEILFYNRELEEARKTNSAVEWDIVEEILSNKSDKRQEKENFWDKYCDENPGCVECLEYDL